jgi:hypothetical protein
MRLAFLWAAFVISFAAQAEDDDPFAPAVPEVPTGEMVYDFAEVHQWENDVVSLGGENDPKIVKWMSADRASHRGVDGKKLMLSFEIASRDYEEALRHRDLNRGVVLMSGDPRFPLLYCWLRPFSTHEGKVYFNLSVPVEQLKTTYVGFIPRTGKKRFLYKLEDVSVALEKDSEK